MGGRSLSASMVLTEHIIDLSRSLIKLISSQYFRAGIKEERIRNVFYYYYYYVSCLDCGKISVSSDKSFYENGPELFL